MDDDFARRFAARLPPGHPIRVGWEETLRLRRQQSNMYDYEFKIRAVNLVVLGGMGYAAVSREMVCGEQTIRAWVAKYLAGIPL